MTVRQIQTKAIISAEDKTGATFSAIAAKMKNLEGVSKRASEVSGSVGASVGTSLGGIATRVRAVAHSIDATRIAIAGLAVVGVEKLARLAESVVDVGVEFDRLARRQAAVLNISEQQQKPLLRQATILGGTTPFKQLEVIEAQTELAKRGIPAESIIPITAAAANYAQAQGVGLPEATKLLEAAAFAEGKRGASPKELAHIADRLVKASQISGMDAPQMEEALRGHMAEAAGVGMPFLMAQIGAMHLAQIPDAGAAAVRFASMLSKPTPGALSAMDAMGIHFKDYVKAGTGMRAGDLSSEFERETGYKLSASGLRDVQGVLSNKAIAGDQEKLKKALGHVLIDNQGLSKGEGKKVSKIIEDFWTASIESVDIEGLERAMLKKGLSGAQAVEIFGKRGGLAFKALSEHAADIGKFEKQIKETPEGLAGREAEKQMGGLAGAKERFSGAWQNLLIRLSEDSTGPLTALYNAGTKFESVLVGAQGPLRDLAAGAVTAAAALITLGAVTGGAKLLGKAGRGEALLGGAGLGWLGGALIPTAPAIVAGIGAGLLAGSTSTAGREGDEDFYRQRRLNLGGARWLGNQPPASGRFTPGAVGNFTELRGAATIKNSMSIFLDPGLIAKEIRNQMDASGNLRGDTGVSMRP